MPNSPPPAGTGSLCDFATEALQPSGLSPARHHRLLIAALEELAAGRQDRLMVLMPPGSAKSTYTSVLFPPWWFTRHPQSSVIAASHTRDLAAHFGRQVRATIGEHEAWLGYGLAHANAAAARWRTSAGGQYFATGVRGPMIGRRADLVIIDDPVKSHEEADSGRARARLWEWYRSELMTRLRPKARVVLVMTRWHEDDLGGRLLAHNPDEWRCIRLPALAGEDDPLGRAPGEPLWPEWEDAAALARKRADVGQRTWSAQFQQEPVPPEVALFRNARFDRVGVSLTHPDGPAVRAWDLASTPKHYGQRDPDYTVGLKLTREPGGRFVILDVVRLQGSPGEIRAAIMQAAAADGTDVVIGIPQDPGSAGKIALSAIVGDLAGYRVVSSRETGSKTTRALPVISQAEAGNIALMTAGWNGALLDELFAFPFGKHDDQVDALSRAFAVLLEQGAQARRLSLAFLNR